MNAGEQGAGLGLPIVQALIEATEAGKQVAALVGAQPVQVTFTSGGTEASVTRIADALGACVAQHNRTEDNGNYRRPGRIAGIEHVVVVRESRALPILRELYPRAQFYLWVHDQMNPGSKRARRLTSTARVLDKAWQLQVLPVEDAEVLRPAVAAPAPTVPLTRPEGAPCAPPAPSCPAPTSTISANTASGPLLIITMRSAR